jgi:hypothetical protein
MRFNRFKGGIVMKSNISKKQSIIFFFFVVIMSIIPALTFAGSIKISPSNFEIVSFRGEWQGNTLYIIGEIRNNGNIPGGPKVEVIARDSQGMLIASQQFWPNSTDNILSGSSCGIKYPITEDTRAKTVEIKVISVSSW